MAVAACLGKGGTLSGAQHCRSAVLDECQLALEDKDELVFVAVPVPLARPFARRKRHQVDAEGGKSSRIAESLARAASTGVIEGLGVASTGTEWHGGKINFGHLIVS